MMIEVYHYTSVEGLRQIESSGYIKESEKGGLDAVHGEGVYLTRLSPTEGRKRIAENNWGGIWQQMEDDGKVERAIKLWIPADKLIQVKSDRDIVIHKGKIYLKDYEYETVRLDQGGGGNSP